MNCFPRSKESVNSINNIFSSISVFLCVPSLIPRLILDLVHFHTAGLEGRWKTACRHMCGTHTHSEKDGSEISGHVCVDHLCSSLKIPVNLCIITHL